MHVSRLSDPLHPALYRQYARVRRIAAAHGLPVSVCGDLPTDPVGLAALLGLGYRTFSLPPASFPEVREIIGAVSIEKLARVSEGLAEAGTTAEIRGPLANYLHKVVSHDAASGVRLSASD